MSRNERSEDRPEPDDTIGAATRALAEATATLTRMIGRQVQDVVPEVSEAVSASLREASRGLADASEHVAKRAGSGRARDRRQQKADRTRADLLDAAATLIAAKGYEGASVGDIATEAGYTKGALYAHFGSKEEMFLDLARERLQFDVLEPDIGIPGLGPERVDLVQLAAAIRAAQDDPDLLLAVEFLTYGLRHPDSRSEIADHLLHSFDLMARRVAVTRRARGGGHDVEAGPVEPDQDDRDIALAVISVFNLATLESKLTASPHLSPEAGARVIARLLDT